MDIAALTGKHSSYFGQCHQVFRLDHDGIERGRYQQVFSLDWHECRTAEPALPSTKATRCLREVFQIDPQLDLCRYTLPQCEEAQARAEAFFSEICPDGRNGNGRFPVVGLHYEGNTSGNRKNLSHEVAREIVEVTRAAGYVPLLLDWDQRSPLLSEGSVVCPGADCPIWGGTGTGDAEVLAAVIERCSLMIGVDSGPLHVAGGTSTPTIGVWTQHHPVHFFDLAENVLHLVPGNHEQLVQGPPAQEFFRQHYRYQVYKQLSVDLPALVEHRLTGENFEQIANRRFLVTLRSTSYGEQYYEEHCLAGLDYLSYGRWQQNYGHWLAEALSWKGKRVLDVGCACGAILRGLGEAGMIVQGLDVNEHMIQLGRQKWPDMAPLLFVCDAVNLHLFPDESWEGLHSAQVAEHWKPELVPFILKELHRVTKPGGIFFCSLDTDELFARQGRTLEHEDPTHICIKPLAWWHEQLEKNGWQLCGEHVTHRLKEHPQSFLRQYDWDWFVARRM